MKLEGKVSTIIFKNDSNSWTVMLLKNKSGYMTAVGQTENLEVGDEIELEGEMSSHKVYGEQFKFTTYKKVLPKTDSALIQYIADNVKGVGKKKAKSIIDMFGEDTINTIRFKSIELLKVKGLNEENVEALNVFFNEEYERWNVINFLTDFGISVVMASKIYQDLGKDTIDIVKQNPYSLLMFVKTLDFKQVDKIGEKLGSFGISGIDPETEIEIDWGNGEWQTMTIDNESITRIDGNSKGTTVRINGLIDYFDCSENDLKSLDVSHNAILATLDCYWTGITALDLSKNTALGKLNCSYNSIGTLDLSNNKALFSLSCYNCELGSLDLSNNTELEEAVVKNNELTSLTVSSNTKLLLLDVQNNEQLKSIDASMLTDLEELQCSYTGLTDLDVTHNTKLIKLICSNNKLTTLDLSKNTWLERLFCDGNQLTSLDLSNNTKLNYLECSGNGMSACALNDLYYNLPKCSTTPTNVNMFIAGINNPNEAEGSETSMATKKGWKVSVDGDGSGCNEAYITIEPTENGILELRNSDNEIVNSGSKVIKNTTVTVKGNPDEGFYLKNVWVNGVSVTNGEFVVKMASVVTAAFDEGSSITEIENSGMKIWSTPGIIRVNAENAHVQVYSTSGALVWEGNIYQEKTIDVTRGIYIVKVRNAQSTQSKKIVVE